MESHLHQNVIYAEYGTATIMYNSPDESDLDTDSISPEVVQENNNNIDNNGNFSIGIDDDDDDDDDDVDNNSESKRQPIAEFYKESKEN